MKHKTLFRIGLKLIGAYLTAFGINIVLMNMGSFVHNYSNFGISAIEIWWYFTISAGISQIAIGCYFFFGGEWVVNKAIPSNRPYCPECGYDLSGAVSCRCPECDTPFDPERVRPSALATGDDNSDDDSDRVDLM